MFLTEQDLLNLLTEIRDELRLIRMALTTKPPLGWGAALLKEQQALETADAPELREVDDVTLFEMTMPCVCYDEQGPYVIADFWESEILRPASHDTGTSVAHIQQSLE